MHGHPVGRLPLDTVEDERRMHAVHQPPEQRPILGLTGLLEHVPQAPAIAEGWREH